MVGVDPTSEENLHEAFMAVLTGDERPLLKMGMPEEEWFDVQYILNRLIEGGLEVWRSDDVIGRHKMSSTNDLQTENKI